MSIRILLLLAAVLTTALGADRVWVTADPNLPAPAQFGLSELQHAIEARGGIVVDGSDESANLHIVAGVSTGNHAAAQLRRLGLELPATPESLTIRRTEIDGKPSLVLVGADARGLMYALLDAADRISWSARGEDLFTHVRDTTETPFLSERAISIYTMQRAYFEQRLHDEQHWRDYFRLLARSRINSFVIIFGYENGGFMAPLYPYFFNLPEFPGVQLTGITAAQQQRNTAALHRLIEIAHEHGVDFVPAPWDHIYRGGVQGGGIAGASELAGKAVPHLATGVTTENVAAYNKTAIARFIELFPEIDGIQFRMHGESGLKPDEMAGFWHEVFTAIRQTRPDLRVDLRAKELPDEIIQDAVGLGLNSRVATKYWMEQQGLPFHPTHINRQNQHDRRHGYADLLRYPQQYKVHWRMWSGGTTRLLLWADPDYVRRFAHSAKLYGGDSFEVNEMLATKMLGEPHDKLPFDIHTPAYRHYRYEFERYWHYYQLWGRLTYDPQTPESVWEREFSRRFGEAGGPLSAGLHEASKVLPRIVASSYLYRLFPTTRGWAEMMRIGDLPEYATQQGSDIQQFQNPRDAARARINGDETAMRTPEENSRWFAQTSQRILDAVSGARTAAGESPDREFLTTAADLEILAHLAAYHSHRLPGAVSYNLYLQTGDLTALDRAIQHEEQAVAAWEKIAASASDVYSPDLAFGVHRVGFPRHWSEELSLLREGLRQLRNERGQHRRPWSGNTTPSIGHAPVRRTLPGAPLQLSATVAANSPVGKVVLHLARNGDDFDILPMNATAEGRYLAKLESGLPEGEARYFIEAVSSSGESAAYPAKPVTITVTADQAPPTVELDRIEKAKAGQPLRISATAQDSSGVASLRLRYRHLAQTEDYRAITMKLDRGTGRHSAEIPAEFVDPAWGLIYFVEAIDKHGNGRLYPDMEDELPYVVVTVTP